MNRVREARARFLATCILDMEWSELVILDAGCGDGLFAEILEEAGQVVRLDLDVDTTACSVQADVRQIPLPANSVDLVWCSQVLEHVADDVGVLLELGRVVKGNGALILGVPNEGCLLAQLRNQVLQPWIAATTSHVHFYTEAEIREKLGRASWQVAGTWREGFFSPHTRLHGCLSSQAWGFASLRLIGMLWKSQAAGLYFICIREATNGP